MRLNSIKVCNVVVTEEWRESYFPTKLSPTKKAVCPPIQCGKSVNEKRSGQTTALRKRAEATLQGRGLKPGPERLVETGTGLVKVFVACFVGGYFSRHTFSCERTKRRKEEINMKKR